MLDIITSILVRTIVAGTPLLLGTLGEVVTERGGILNLGIEGMMSLGAVTGFIVTFTTGNPWFGMIAAILAGSLFSMLHAFVTISLRANQVVSGLALTMLGLGLSGPLGKTLHRPPPGNKDVSHSHSRPVENSSPGKGSVLSGCLLLPFGTTGTDRLVCDEIY